MTRLLSVFLIACAVSAADLQRAAEREMGGRSGTAIILEVNSGKLLAIYRPEVAARRLARPGSAIKPFTLMALLSYSATAQTIRCPLKLHIGARQMDCTHPRSPEPFDAVAALAYSCNYYFATRAAALRNADLVETFTRAGLVSRTGLNEQEAVGEIAPPSSVDARRLLALGEANILVTPLAMAAAYRRLAIRSKDRSAFASLYEGLEAATEYGTARQARPPGVVVAGKTGTASDSGGAVHAWFAGYAPADNPRIVVVIFLEQGVGGRDAAPAARELFQVALHAP